MKSRNEIQSILIKHKPLLQEQYDVKRIGIFGSYVRDEATAGSDVDILVEFSQPVGWEFIDLKEYLEDVLGMKVDLVTTGALKPQIKERILREVVFA